MTNKIVPQSDKMEVVWGTHGGSIMEKKELTERQQYHLNYLKERYNHRSETQSKPYYLALSDWIRSEKVTNLQETEIAVIVDQFTLWVDEKSVERNF